MVPSNYQWPPKLWAMGEAYALLLSATASSKGFLFSLCSIFNYLGSARQVFASASLPWNSSYTKQKAAGFAL